MYTIQEINTCCHKWVTKTLDKAHNPYCAPIWELTKFNQIEMVLHVMFLAVPEGAGNHDNIS